MKKLWMALATAAIIAPILLAQSSNNPGLVLQGAFTVGHAVRITARNQVVDTGGNIQNVVDVQRICAAAGTPVNGTNDNTACIGTALTTAAGNNQSVYFPSGVYCLKTGPLNVTQPSLRLFGPMFGTGALLSTCGNNVNSLVLNADSIELHHIFVTGAGMGATVGNNAITLGASCLRCYVHDVNFSGGNFALEVKTEDVMVYHTRASNAYGAALVQLTGPGAAGYFVRNEWDQNFPVSNPAPLSVASIPAWAAATPYATGNLVTVGGYVLQESVATCTSGGSAPALANYGVNMPDNTCNWLLVAPSAYTAFANSGAVNDVYLELNDLSGPYTTNVVRITSATTSGVYIVRNTIGGFMGNNNAILLGGTASSIHILGNLLNGFLGTAAAGISLTNSSVVEVRGNSITGIGSGTGVVIAAASTASEISGNDIYTSNGTAIFVGANTTDFIITNNKLGPSLYGTNGNAITVSAGTSDYYTITGNNVHGLPITDGGTGIHKTVSGNN